ncbi:DUF4328 domain-containing protein [Nocardia sp. NPDC052254]|uniref:DUF4328 domain-containing protein n=1 Tax=Nocardia sp. NPDC052254 TaxID=3155681 RepID=UPI00344033BA
MSVQPPAFTGYGSGPRPLGAWGFAAIALVGGTVVMLLISAVIDGVGYAGVERSPEEPQELPQDWSSDSWAGQVAWLFLLGAAVAVIVWMWRARRNAEALCAAPHRLPIGWVIGGWFCPVVNVWFPHTILTDVVRASDPRTPACAEELRGGPGDALVTGWWWALLAGWAATLLSLRLSAPRPWTERTGDVVVYGTRPVGGWGFVVAEMIGVGAFAISAFCLGAVIIRVQQAQEYRLRNPGAAMSPGWAAGQAAWAQPAAGTGKPAFHYGDRPFDIAVAVVAALLALGGGVVVVTLADRSGRSTDDVTASAPVTTPHLGATSEWGDVQWIVDMFTVLLPSAPTPAGTERTVTSLQGYRGITCPQTHAGVVRCGGDDPAPDAPSLSIYCRQDGRSPVPPSPGAAVIDLFTRPSGVTTVWHGQAGPRAEPAVSLSFGDAARGRCSIFSTWDNHSENDLVDWWRAAPL